MTARAVHACCRSAANPRRAPGPCSQGTAACGRPGECPACALESRPGRRPLSGTGRYGWYEAAQPRRRWAVGDSVVVADRSEAHGDKGKVLQVQDDGIVLVQLEQGCVWPVTADELQPAAEVTT